MLVKISSSKLYEKVLLYIYFKLNSAWRGISDARLDIEGQRKANTEAMALAGTHRPNNTKVQTNTDNIY